MSSVYSIKTVRKRKVETSSSLSTQMTAENPSPQIRIQSKFFPHLSQKLIRESKARFNLVFAGRRFGKSVLAVNSCIERAALKPSQKIWYCSPFYKQTKEIAWNLFDFYTPKEFIAKKNESELKITFINGSEISLKGTDNHDSLVGVGLNFCVLDEFPLMDADVWYKVVRPMMIDTKGECLFIGTPRGFTWSHELYTRTRTDNDFASFFFKTVDNTAVEDIAGEVGKAKLEATSELDQVIFRQEYEASFEIITGRPRFDIEIIQRLKESASEPIGKIGLLDTYEVKDAYVKYVMGIDTSEGLITGDNSSVSIINCRDYSLAAHYSGKIAPDVLASYIKEWGIEYNRALAVVECNNHGLVTLNYLKDIYPHIYYRKTFDKQSNIWTEKIGWQTSARTKPLLIGVLDKALRSGLKVKAMQTINELMTYIIEEDGTTNASEGKKDDSVISLALAVQGYLESAKEFARQEPEPKENTIAYILERNKKEAQVGHRWQGARYAA